jgi:hypothetical protein
MTMPSGSWERQRGQKQNAEFRADGLELGIESDTNQTASIPNVTK